MRRLFFWIPVIAGTAATIMMMRRGESFGTSARKAFGSPLRSFAAEFKGAR